MVTRIEYDIADKVRIADFNFDQEVQSTSIHHARVWGVNKRRFGKHWITPPVNVSDYCREGRAWRQTFWQVAASGDEVPTPIYEEMFAEPKASTPAVILAEGLKRSALMRKKKMDLYKQALEMDAITPDQEIGKISKASLVGAILDELARRTVALSEEI